MVVQHTKKVLLNNYAVRTEVENGIEYTVVPVVMMVEGVHSGNSGPLLYLVEDLIASVEQWEGTPIVINHPVDATGFISAHQAGVIDRAGVGIVRNPKMSGTKLMADAYINMSKMSNVSLDAFNAIQEGVEMEVSIGVMARAEPTTGIWNGERYSAISRDYTPDHLALLPNDRGACSWDDGCGLRNNKRKVLLIQNKMTDEKLKLEEAGILLTLNGRTVELFGSSELLANEVGYREISQKIQGKLDSFDNERLFNYLEEVFDGFFVYRVSNRENGQSSLYKREYQINEATEELTLSEDAVSVTKKVSYEAVVTNRFTEPLVRTINNFTNKKGGIQMETQKGSPCKVNALIANEASKFTEADRQWLSEQSDDTLDKLAPVVVNKTVEAPVTEAQLQAILNSEKDPNAFIDKYMPEGMRESVKTGIRLNQEKRDSLIKGIVANSKFTEDVLKAWKTEDLETLSASVVKEEESYISPIFNRGVESDSDEDEVESMMNFKSAKA